MTVGSAIADAERSFAIATGCVRLVHARPQYHGGPYVLMSDCI